jgi:hypothetical protein
MSAWLILLCGVYVHYVARNGIQIADISGTLPKNRNTETRKNKTIWSVINKLARSAKFLTYIRDMAGTELEDVSGYPDIYFVVILGPFSLMSR